MKRVILDTNFLIMPYQFGVDIFEDIPKVVLEEHEIVTLGGVIRELEHLAKSKGKDSLAARIGLELVTRKGIRVVHAEEKDVDDAIIGLSDQETIVATNDKGLMKRLKHKNVKILYLRGKNRLELG